ncbi:LytTR family DNA-binding domain-containing protein [soil metagenome]
MNAVIIEDEAVIAKDLRRLLQDIAPHIDVQATLPSVRAAMRWFSQHTEPDLLFMDIQLSDGISLELFTYFNIQCPIIFTTAYDEYAVKAFKLNSVDYLLKPVDEEELAHALEKLKKRQSTPSLPFDLIQAISQHVVQPPMKAYREKMLVHQRNAIVLVDVAEVSLFYRDEIIFLLRNDGQTFMTDQTAIDETEALLDPGQFFRANRAQIVNLSAVDSYRQEATGKLYVKLKNAAAPIIEISRDKAHSFRRWLNR